MLYDNNGNVVQNYNFTANQTRTITWSSYNKPTQIVQGNTTINFKYGANRELFLQETNSGGNSVFRHSITPVYEKESEQGKDTYIHYLKAGGQTIGIYKAINDFGGAGDSEETRYFHRDHLGSVTAITDESAQIVERLSYDPHGKRRPPSWEDAASQITASNTLRGFTGHRMLDDVGIIHMGGRIYDPDLGRFLSADPFIQEPGNQQNFNRYSYVLNNPLSYTDPSGFFFKSIFKLFKAAFKLVGSIVKFTLTNPITQTLRTIVLGSICGPPCAAASSAFNTAINGGSIGDIVKSAAISYASAQAFEGIGNHFGDGHSFLSAIHVQKIVAHGLVGGAFSVAQGGDFFSGFLSAGVTQAFAPAIDGISKGNYDAGSVAARVTTAAVVGGTAAVLGGGKFANGAITGAFSRLFNEESVFFNKIEPRAALVELKDSDGNVFAHVSPDSPMLMHQGASREMLEYYGSSDSVKDFVSITSTMVSGAAPAILGIKGLAISGGLAVAQQDVLGGIGTLSGIGKIGTAIGGTAYKQLSNIEDATTAIGIIKEIDKANQRSNGQ